ncbi:MAG TPA: glycosyltransferase family 2 protein, partial [Methylophilaceae bacterium]|nr:glycosyltransferase family 2 protein [Methylophilaceae bacterium]
MIPAYNEAGKISAVVREVRESGYQNIVVVDDGSQDNTKQVAQLAGAICLRHRLNRGKGAATKTGIEAAKLQGADTVVTMDGDGQHSAADIKQLI